jgi:molybdenum cofactor biosynthesis enzyme MoaA
MDTYARRGGVLLLCILALVIFARPLARWVLWSFGSTEHRMAILAEEYADAKAEGDYHRADSLESELRRLENQLRNERLARNERVPAASNGQVSVPSFYPVPVARFCKGAIKLRLTPVGKVTEEVHLFREMLPQKADVFAVARDSEEHGRIRDYRLRYVAKREVYTFADVEVKKIAGEWTITDEGWSKIKGELQAKLRVSLGGPIN